MAKIRLRSPWLVGSAASSGSVWSGRSTSPFIRMDMMPMGTTMQTMLGRIRWVTMTGVVNWPPIHSMVVVTSPMRDQAPPALAEMMTAPAKSQRVGLSAMSFRSREIITMEVVRLSSAAEKKKVRVAMIHSRRPFFRVLIRSVMTANPLWASTNSTMVMAPRRKKRMLEISSMWWSRRCSKKTFNPPCPSPPWPCRKSLKESTRWSGAWCQPRTRMAQHSVPVIRALAALSMWRLCSKAMSR